MVNWRTLPITVVSTPEIFRYWLQGGRIDIGFLGAAQIDRYANINTTVIGNYLKPTIRLPGAGGAPEIASSAREVLIILRQSRRTFVPKLDFITSMGFGVGGNSRERLGLTGKGPVAVITDLCILEPDAVARELTVTSLHKALRANKLSRQLAGQFALLKRSRLSPRQTDTELTVLRDLQHRTQIAHGGITGEAN